jgi:hypothetical protein
MGETMANTEERKAAILRMLAEMLQDDRELVADESCAEYRDAYEKEIQIYEALSTAISNDEPIPEIARGWCLIGACPADCQGLCEALVRVALP